MTTNLAFFFSIKEVTCLKPNLMVGAGAEVATGSLAATAAALASRRACLAALVSGWYVTEVGRQPWLVYGLLTTAQAASAVPRGNIALSLLMYLMLYVALLSAYVSVVFHLAKKAVDKGAEPSANLKGLVHV